MDQKRWDTFPKSTQLLMIGSEFIRAGTWQKKDKEKFSSALERALGLIDHTLRDRKWGSEARMLLGLRDEVAKFYIGQRTDDVLVLYRAL